jgi:thymidylate synthase (FAD)
MVIDDRIDENITDKILNGQKKVKFLKKYCIHNPEEFIALCASVSHKKQIRKVDDAEIKKYVEKIVIDYGHESVAEHVNASFLFSDVSRALTHQLVRHRLCAFTQKSQRYVDEYNFDYVIPPSIETRDTILAKDQKIYKEYLEVMEKTRKLYKTFYEAGIPKEDVRFILPNATTTEIVVTANLRQWRHMIKMRCSHHAQWEIRECFYSVLYDLYDYAPSVFKDLYNEFMLKNFE